MTLTSMTSTKATAEVSRVFAGRFAQILRAAGKRRTVVLSSSWRQPHHQKRVERLEQEISRHLGESFHFDDRTPLGKESSAEDRLRSLGDFIACPCFPSEGKLRLLVLEDFFITPMRGWSCGGIAMDSVEAAELFLLRRCKGSVDAAVKVLHTYDEWVTPRGRQVQVGIGLTMEHLRGALDFLGSAGCGVCGNADVSEASTRSEGSGASEDSDSDDEGAGNSDPTVQAPAPRSIASLCGL